MPNAVTKYHKIEAVDSAHPVFLNSIRIKYCQEVRMTELVVESYAVLVHSAAPIVGVEGSAVGAECC